MDIKYLIRKAPDSPEYLENFNYATGRYVWTRDRKKAWTLEWRQAQSRLYLVQGNSCFTAVIVKQ